MEGIINFLRFELLYPKLIETSDEKYTKGFLPSLITNTFIGAYLGGQYYHAEGAIAGGLVTITQMALGKGVRKISKSISEKYKPIKANR